MYERSRFFRAVGKKRVVNHLVEKDCMKLYEK